MNLIKILEEKTLIPQYELIKFASTAPHRYKEFDIPKRNGKGVRHIAQPSKELKFFQRIIVSHLSKILPVHKKATAYKAQVGIKENALIHRANTFILKVDFENFFPSIKPIVLFSIFNKHNIILDETDEFLLEKLLFKKDKKNRHSYLSIGSPSSPFISNCIMYFFDVEADKICENRGIKYSRYADDITLSTNKKNNLFDLPDLLGEILKKELIGLIKINKEKTVFSSKRHNRHITGVTLSNNGELSLGRNRKRLISSMVHRFSLGQLDGMQTSKLQGLISFSYYIEPSFLDRLKLKYGLNIIEKIRNANLL
ncbi:retron St85 family RNA-directed DNA polymerase [Shewanella mangrovisoli]|uniref:retron St85 family RNA-directed DNA polymerase n=1 Tax=Shewanella mangrovisoli TaxID=2864211 RepID=UPI00313E2E20